MQLFHVSEITS